jgi:hypothetical protein
MAESARTLLTLTIWQIVIGAIGAASVLAALIYTARGTRAATAAAEAAVEANRLNREAFIAEQRPWLKIEAGIGGPLHWNMNGGNLSFVFDIENIGSSPALTTNVNIKLIIEPEDLKLEEKQRAFAEEVRTRGPFTGYTVFPGDKIAVPCVIAIERDEFVAASTRIGVECDWVMIFSYWLCRLLHDF